MVIEILTATLVIVTAFYSWATFRILIENERVVETYTKHYQKVIK